ncbi:MAG TPA: matrixin family metalloprotease [Phycisphaerae bacterium]|nr:matrixin family metalloprotease [Phycisphaerae bacterium]HOM52099.1 matrixin family metalloprotease [Phycisphaerae bacterium]HON65303.1 matrixin family metalloprotease [Phycisphaerae bacterium]HOQ86501.1 matrixin family metalloprotease [Phycisphaerae bacterium]HPP27626.1 matrixin family metalloprotease [Phycisphaerae bacterium]
MDSTGNEETARPGELMALDDGALEEQEPNDDFAAGMAVTASRSVRIEGRVDSPDDYDVFTLGPLGDNNYLQAAIETPVEGETCLCVFDPYQRLLARTCAKNSHQPRALTLFVPEPVEHLFLVASIPQAGVPNAYAATVDLTRNNHGRTRRPQLVLLSFDGAESVTVAGRHFSVIPPFDAASIDSRYAGRTNVIVRSVLEKVRADYEGIDVQIYLASDPAVPPGPHSIVYFGTANPDLLGVADGVDPFNDNVSEAAIVYTETFHLFSAFEPDDQEIAQALANVTTHEIGHLLGLRHTHDPDDIMDVTATARRLMSDQWFKHARLHASVCPMGYQDSPAMLSWTVGGTLAAPPSKESSTHRHLGVDGPDDFDIPRAWLGSHCSLEP